MLSESINCGGRKLILELGKLNLELLNVMWSEWLGIRTESLGRKVLHSHGQFSCLLSSLPGYHPVTSNATD